MKRLVKKEVLLVLFLAAFMVLGAAPSHIRAEKVLTIAEGVGPQTLDPHKSTVQAVNNIAFAICEPLTYVDYSSGAPKVIKRPGQILETDCGYDLGGQDQRGDKI